MPRRGSLFDWAVPGHASVATRARTTGRQHRLWRDRRILRSSPFTSVIERLWRSMKEEDICLKGCADGREAKAGIAASIAFCNARRPPAALHSRSALEPSCVRCDLAIRNTTWVLIAHEISALIIPPISSCPTNEPNHQPPHTNGINVRLPAQVCQCS